MDIIGQNAVYEDQAGNLEIVGSNGHTIFVSVEERRKLASRIGKQPNRITCMFCQTPIPYGFECGNCHRAHEDPGPEYVWTVLQNGQPAFSGKGTRDDAITRLWQYASKKGAMHYHYDEGYYYDDEGNWFALRILGEIEQLPDEPIRVKPIFENA